MTAGVNATTANGLRRFDRGVPARRPGNGTSVRDRLCGLFDRVIARSSLVSNDPVLDVRDFAWTQALRDDWRAIRDEARGVADAGAWHAVPLWEDGHPAAGLARCPRTAALIGAIPELRSAAFAVVAAGAHIPDRRGATKGLLTCHLGLVVPRDGDVRMRIRDRVVRWAEGETLVFDDTCRHEVWNDSGGARVVLRVRFDRPLRHPGKWLAGMMMRFVG